MEEDIEGAHDPELEGYEDLFEDSPEEKTKAREPIRTTIPYHEIERFTSPILANRRASEIYLAWHSKFFPGLENEGYRRNEADWVEQYLEQQLQDWGLFNHGDDFNDNQVDSNGEPRKVNEKILVWVVEEALQGPGN